MDSIHHCVCFTHKQRGVALVMAMVFLLMLTIIGVTAVSTSALEEKMAGNLSDKNLSFQAAESASRSRSSGSAMPSMRAASRAPFRPPSTATVATGATPAWENVDWSATANLVVYPNTPTASVSGELSAIRTQPKYIIEDLGEVPETGGSISLSSSYKRGHKHGAVDLFKAFLE